MANKKERRAKVDVLRQSGTLNLYPNAVIDELFLSNEFFDPCDLMQVKYEMLRRVRLDGLSVSEASRLFGFSRPSFYSAQEEFNRVGLVGFVAKSRGPQAAHKLSDAVLTFLNKCQTQDPEIRTPDMVRIVKEEFDIDVHKRSIERAFNRAKKKLNG